MLFFFPELFLRHLPQSSHPHWRGFWFCLQSLQENDSYFSRKPHLVESRFPQWWNDAGSYRSAALVLCQERRVLSLYFRIPSLISALCPSTTKNASHDPSFLPLRGLMLKWNLELSFLKVLLGPSWVWVHFYDLMKQKYCRKHCCECHGLEIQRLNFRGFLYFPYYYTEIFLFLLLFWLLQKVFRAVLTKCSWIAAGDVPAFPRGSWAGHW